GRSDSDALDVFRTACSNDPASGRLHGHYARALLAQGSYDAAADEAGEAARLLPGDATALDLLAAVYAQAAGLGPIEITRRLDSLALPVESRLVVREAMCASNPSLRAGIHPAYASEEASTTDPAVRSVLQAHAHLDNGDTERARADLDAGVAAPRT